MDVETVDVEGIADDVFVGSTRVVTLAFERRRGSCGGSDRTEACLLRLRHFVTDRLAIPCRRYSWAIHVTHTAYTSVSSHVEILTLNSSAAMS